MGVHGYLRISALVVGLACMAGMSEAAPPWARLLSPERIEAESGKTYNLAEENGPWMIMACSFSGEGAEQQAKDLVLELRKRYKLSAYSHKVRFDFKDAPGRGIDQFGAPLRMRYQRGHELEEFAVLVGDYPAVDDPNAQKTLQKLKYSTPDCLQLADGKKTNQSLAGWRMMQKQFQETIASDKRKKGPMGHAFITTNPLLPKEYFAPKGVDKLVIQMNEGVKHSLLDCPGKYTVQVARFTGTVILDQRAIREIENGKEMKSSLADAADKAHRLTEALRMKGYDAYEFHDRYASIVCVGSFDGVGTPRPDGRIEINPKIHAIMKTFGAEQSGALPNPAHGSSSGVLPMKLKSLAGIPFDVQPIPVEVPRRSISQEMAARTRISGKW